ncbi:MAG: MFS transporter [Aigarchaeota archaeon]|nr:MFS transporter [Aigarchaeota archaeon]MDW8092975.1 MFS transporter [Nitrososphaerota archaeon]
MSDYTSALDSSRFTGQHWKLFITISADYFLNGVMFSVAPLTAYIVAPEMAIFILATTLLAETAGAISFGSLADKMGRRVIFTTSLLLEGVALSLLFFFYTNPIIFWVLVSVMTFGVGGEFGAAYATLAELIPVKHRGKVILLTTNFWNVGASVIAGLALFVRTIYDDPFMQVTLLLSSAIATLIVVGVARVTFPESPRWLMLRNRLDEAYSITRRFTSVAVTSPISGTERPANLTLSDVFKSYRFRFAVIATLTVSQYVTYGMLAYYLPYSVGFAFGINSAPMVVFVSNLGASMGAFILAPLIDRSRKSTTLWSFAGGTVGALLVTASHATVHPLGFYLFLFFTMIFSEWAWGVVSALQSEIFPTPLRASVVGFQTGLTGIAGASVVISSRFLDATPFLLISVTLWALGLVSSLLWKTRGIETARKPLETISR